MKKEIWRHLFLAVFIFLTLPCVGRAEAPAVIPLDEQDIGKMRLVTEAYMKMQQHYYRELGVSDLERFTFRLAVIAGALLKTPGGLFEERLEQLIYGTIEWMVLEMRDPSDQHSKFIHKQFLQRVVRENFKSQFQGIGIEVEKKEEGIFIATVYQGSSAEENGVMVGDKLIRIGDRDLATISFDEAKAFLDVPAGALVQLVLTRQGVVEEIHVTLTCRIIVVPSVHADFFADTRIGYIKVAEFRNETADEVKEQIKTHVASGATALILDLRGNDGGDFDQAVALCNLFLPEEKLVAYFMKRDVGRKDQLTRLPAMDLGSIKKMAILVDEKTGSSSEIVAGALRFHRHDRVIGIRTKGLGSLKNMIGLSDGSVLFLITSRTFLPDGTTFDVTGIEPDQVVEGEPEQLAEAVRFLTREDMAVHQS